MENILVIDEDEHILHGIRRMLRSIEKGWNVVTVSDGEKALQYIEEQEEPFDLVICEMVMNNANGEEILGQIREKSPTTVRFGLTASTTSQTMLRAANVVHQLILKPCHPQVLHNLIARALSLRDHIRSPAIKKILMTMDSLPTAPGLYEDVLAEIRSSSPDIRRIGELISKDPSMSAKILQVVNSAFVGTRNYVSDPVHACVLLGFENIKGIVLLAGAVQEIEACSFPPGYSPEALWTHSVTVGEFARRIAEAESCSRSKIDDAFSAGLLHDLGMLALAMKLPDSLKESVELARKKHITLVEAERTVMGATHSQIGAFLLDLWGLPNAIVEAIAFHDFPSASPESKWTIEVDPEERPEEEGIPPLVAVHVANYFCEEEKDDGSTRQELDTEYLTQLGLIDRVEAWWDICHTVD